MGDGQRLNDRGYVVFGDVLVVVEVVQGEDEVDFLVEGWAEKAEDAVDELLLI